jgi:hypothetical protein
MTEEPMSLKDNTPLFTEYNSIPSRKLVSFRDMAQPFQIQARYSSAPAGQLPQLARWRVHGMTPGQDGQTLKLKVAIRMSQDGVVNVIGAHSIEEIEKIVQPPAEEKVTDEAAKPKEDAEGDTPMDGDDASANDGASQSAADADKPSEQPAPEQAEADEAENKDAEGDSPMQNASEEPEQEQPKKKKYTRKTELKVEIIETLGADEKTHQDFFEKETKMAAQDKLIQETNDARNALESYVLEMRSKVQDQNDLQNFMSQAEMEAFVESLNKMENWLYDDGDDAQKSELKKKLAELEKVGGPVVKRQWEARHREEYVSQLKTFAVQCEMFAASTDEKYAHIAADKKNEVAAAAKGVQDFLNEELAKQDRLTPDQDPVLTCDILNVKLQELRNKCQPIMNTPKPKPKPQPKPEAEKKSQSGADNADGKPKESATEKTADEGAKADDVGDASAGGNESTGNTAETAGAGTKMDTSS